MDMMARLSGLLGWAWWVAMRRYGQAREIAPVLRMDAGAVAGDASVPTAVLRPHSTTVQARCPAHAINAPGIVMPEASRRPRNDATDARWRESSAASGKTPILHRDDEVLAMAKRGIAQAPFLCLGIGYRSGVRFDQRHRCADTSSDPNHDRGRRDSAACSNPFAPITRGTNE